MPVEKKPLAFSETHLKVVREGMEKVTQPGGTGHKASIGLKVKVAGKTGTAEIGRGATRRKNAWFIAYAPIENPVVAIAMVVEYGDSGRGTAAPKVRRILGEIFGYEEDGR
jgi:penicillin-binding protein 2